MDGIEAGKKLLEIRRKQQMLEGILKEAEDKKLNTDTPVFHRMRAMIAELEQEYQTLDIESQTDRMLTTWLMLGSMFNDSIIGPQVQESNRLPINGMDVNE